VVRRGQADVRELPDLLITKISVGALDNNAYLLRCRRTGEQLLIDAADDADVLLRALQGPLEHVVTTHRHPDHWAALSTIRRATNARTLAHGLDADGISVPTDVRVSEGDRIVFGAVELEVIQLTGHTPGSIALLYQDPAGHPHVFTGDCLFPGGVGTTFGDGAAFARLVDDVERKLFDRLRDDAWVYPGHGADTTLGLERPSLPEWRRRGW
jgi:glyoxylase-like metal-dependent hydrolase (beta-lactamase superfamily II)